MASKLWTIGQVAKAGEVNVETIRFYQRKGLLPVPPRPYGGIRRYDQKTLARLKFIQAAKRLGFSLEEIGQLLKLEDGTHCAEARELARRKLEDVRVRISDLKRIEAALDDLIQRCDRAEGQICCPLISVLESGLK
ncbi:MAG: Hg(II)-responsive transcriptional regulator [Methylohalobius sp.]|nr:Hg(II)-responsive transcriptional regulator [Methylohalobius sp.]